MNARRKNLTELGRLSSRVLARARSATGDPATNISEAIRLQAARGDQEAVILQAQNDEPQQ
jgi:hypothetical protein